MFIKVGSVDQGLLEQSGFAKGKLKMLLKREVIKWHGGWIRKMFSVLPPHGTWWGMQNSGHAGDKD